MKLSRILLLGAAVAVVGFGISMQKAQAVTDNLTVDAQILAALTLDCSVSDLDFGYLAAGQAGTVTVDTAGARTGPGALLIAGGTVSAGTCDLTGTDGVNIEIDAAGGNVTGPAATTIAVGNWTFDAGGGETGGPHTFQTAAGVASVDIGADLGPIAGTEPAGAYTGTFVVTANYQ